MVGTAYDSICPRRCCEGTVGDYIDDVLPGDVIVLDNNGRADYGLGDILL
jgi:regulator of RNase E activity RraA